MSFAQSHSSLRVTIFILTLGLMAIGVSRADSITASSPAPSPKPDLEGIVHIGYAGAQLDVARRDGGHGPVNIALMLRQKDGLKDCANTAVAPSLATIDIMQTGLRMSFAFTQPSTTAHTSVSGTPLGNDDSAAIQITRITDDPKMANTVTAWMNPHGACYEASLDPTKPEHDACVASLDPLKTNKRAYGGTLLIKYSDLGGLPGRFSVQAFRNVISADLTCTQESDPSLVAVDTSTRLEDEQWYLGTAVYSIKTIDMPKAGQAPRQSHVFPEGDIYWSLSPGSHFDATFGQTGSSLFRTRTDVLKNAYLSSAVANIFQCHGCGVYQTVDVDPFSVTTSKKSLGLDLGVIGADYSPLDFSRVGDIATGYKLLTNSDAPVALASFRGTGDPVSTPFFFNDVAMAASTKYQSRSKLTTGSLSVLHVIANHSASPDNPFVSSSRSSTSEYAAQLVRKLRETKPGPLAASSSDLLSASAVLHYATGYSPADQDFFIALGLKEARAPYSETELEAPAVATTANLVFGYREIASAYQPLNAATDALAGTQGVFAEASRERAGAETPLAIKSASFLIYRFSNSGGLRSTATQEHLAIQLFRAASLNLDWTIGVQAASTLARSTPFLVPDSAGGTALFPNNSAQASIALDYARWGIKAGYQRSYAGTCNSAAITIPPCTANVKYAVTGSAFAGSSQNFLAVSYGTDQFPSRFAIANPPYGSSPSYTTVYNVLRAFIGQKLGYCSVAVLSYNEDPDGTEGPNTTGGAPRKGTTTAMVELNKLRNENDFLPDVGFILGYQSIIHFNPLPGKPRRTTDLEARLRFGLPSETYAQQMTRDCDRNKSP